MDTGPETPVPDSPSPGRIELAPGAWARESDLRFTFVRSSGPGGQSVNKLSTKAQLRIAVTAIKGLDGAARDRLRALAGRRLVGDDELLLTTDAHRSQQANRRTCLDRLASLVGEAAVAPAPRRPTKPTRASVTRRLETKRRKSQQKQARRAPDDDDL